MDIPNAIMVPMRTVAVVTAIRPLRHFRVIAWKACSPDSTPRPITQMLRPRFQPPAGYFYRVNADNARVRPVCRFGISHDYVLHSLQKGGDFP